MGRGRIIEVKIQVVVNFLTKCKLRDFFFISWRLITLQYYSAIKKNSFESVLMRWMKLEPIIQSEVSQKGRGRDFVYI